MISEGWPALPEKASALLQQQKITATEPGTILQDFQTLLDFVGDTNSLNACYTYSIDNKFPSR